MYKPVPPSGHLYRACVGVYPDLLWFHQLQCRTVHRHASSCQTGWHAVRKMSHSDKFYYMGRAKRIWYLSPMRAAKVQASLRIRAVSPEPPLLAHTSSESRGTFRQKTRSLAPLNGWACAVKVCHDGMLEDTNSLGGAHILQCEKNLSKVR